MEDVGGWGEFPSPGKEKMCNTRSFQFHGSPFLNDVCFPWPLYYLISWWFQGISYLRMHAAHQCKPKFLKTFLISEFSSQPWLQKTCALGIILYERSQTRNSTYCLTPFIMQLMIRQTLIDTGRCQNSDFLGRGLRESGLAKAWSDGNVLYLDLSGGYMSAYV